MGGEQSKEAAESDHESQEASDSEQSKKASKSKRTHEAPESDHDSGSMCSHRLISNLTNHEETVGDDEDAVDDVLDLSLIEDTRQGHQSSPPARPASAQFQVPKNFQTETRVDELPHLPSPPRPLPAKTPSKRKTKLRASSGKKRRRGGNRVSSDEEGEKDAQQHLSHVTDSNPQPEIDEQTRIAEAIMLKSHSKRIREMEPEMFGDYAMSDESMVDDNAQSSVPAIVEVDLSRKQPSPTLGQVDGFKSVNSPARKTEAEQQVHQERAVEEPATSAVDEAVPFDTTNDIADSDVITMADAPTDSQHPLEPAMEAESASDTTAPTNVFDDVSSPALIEETPDPKENKRKRLTGMLSPPRSKKTYSTKKRKKNTPPTFPDLDLDDVEDDRPLIHAATKALGLAKRQSSMERFAQPYKKGSGLRHPVYNPDTPEKIIPRANFEIVIPVSRAGPSTHPISEKSASGLKRRNKTSPALEDDSERRNLWDVNNQPDANGLARTVARRALGQTGNDSSSSESEDDSDIDGNDANGIGSPRPKKQRSKGKQRARSADRDGSEDGEDVVDPSLEDPANGKSKSKKSKRESTSNTTPRKRQKRESTDQKYRCPICNVEYASEAFLNKHMAHPGAHAFKCVHCDQQFSTKGKLTIHKKEMGHGISLQGSTGRFTADEHTKVQRWVKGFCQMHDINRYEFNELMTASRHLWTKENWPYKFVDKDSFLQEFYDVLPDRDVRSMQRYRTRFQNVDMSRDWTEEDDADILRLVAELGKNWLEIGNRITRDSEAVRARWRNKLELGPQGNLGEFSPEERQKFDDAVEEIQKSTVKEEGKELNDTTFNWLAVSKKVGTRTSQQCANHWRAMYGRSVRGRWVDPGTSALLQPKSPSRMESRLKGKSLSKERIEDSDADLDEADGDDQATKSEPEASDESDHEGADQSSSDDGSIADKADQNGNENSSDEEDDEPGNPLAAQVRTPGNRLTTSQAFDQTQAHTSGLKSSAHRRQRDGPSQDQPTPGIAVQHRPDPSPDFTRRLGAVLTDTQGPSADVDQNSGETESVAEHDVEDRGNDGEESEDVQDDPTADADNSDAESSGSVSALPEPTPSNNGGLSRRDGATSAEKEDRMEQIFKSASRKKKEQEGRKKKKKHALPFLDDSDSD